MVDEDPMPAIPEEFVCPYAEPGQNRCPTWRCDCFVDEYPDDPFGLHPEAYAVHLPQLDGSCLISVAGQGHLPCSLHVREEEPPPGPLRDPEPVPPEDV